MCKNWHKFRIIFPSAFAKIYRFLPLGLSLHCWLLLPVCGITGDVGQGVREGKSINYKVCLLSLFPNICDLQTSFAQVVICVKAVNALASNHVIYHFINCINILILVTLIMVLSPNNY